MVLHAQCTRGKCVIHSDDTDVLVLLRGHAHKLGKCYSQIGKGAKHRIVWISEVADQFGKQVAEGIPKQEACEALMGLHALTGCYTVSAFTSKGKWRPEQMVVKNQNYAVKVIATMSLVTATPCVSCELPGGYLTYLEASHRGVSRYPFASRTWMEHKLFHYRIRMARI